MRFSSFAVITFATAAALMSACIGDAPTPVNSAAIGSDGGGCFTNGTCNSGLTCVLVNGVGVCRPGGADGSVQDTSFVDQASGTDTSINDSGPDSGLPNCNITLNAAFTKCNTGQTCFDPFSMASACSACGGWQVWTCGASSQCSKPNPACCLTQSVLKVSPPTGKMCSGGTIALSAKPSPTDFGGICKQDCSQDTAQLCTTNSECPPNQWCAPVTVTQGPGALSGVIMGVCQQ